MAKIGFEYIVAGELDTDVSVSQATATFSNSHEIGPGAKITGTPNSSDVKDYGDDRMVETDVSVTGGTLSLELNEPTMVNEAWILGHSLADDGGMVRNSNDIPPYVGIGVVGKSIRDHVLVYKAKAYLKTQFKEPTDDNQTKQESVTFNHTTLEGNLFTLDNGDWKWENEYETLDEAKAALNTLFGISDEEAAA